MKKYLYFNYYRDSDQDRYAEIMRCVSNNLSLDFIDGYHVWLEDSDHARDLPSDPRISLHVLDRRMEFHDAIQHAHKQLEPDSVVIIVNLDIYLAATKEWSCIDQKFFLRGYENKAMVCTRFNHVPGKDKLTLGIEAENWRKGDFCDAYVFKTPLVPSFLQEDLRFAMGTPQCDNTMMALMTRHYHTYSWGGKYVIIHVDSCRQASGAAKKYASSPASKRLREHRNIPTQQPWQELLDTGREPVWTWTWFDIERTK